MAEGRTDRLTADLLAPTERSSSTYRFALVPVLALVALGLAAWIYQLAHGLTVTGMTHSVAWGIYLTNFVFFIGISHAGTLISAILRVSNAEWRRPVTRVAEAITVFSLIIATTQIIADVGHPERLLNLIIRGRFQSPLLWDVLCVSIYLLSSIFYLYFALIPDLAIQRDHLRPGAPAWRKRLYTALSLGWRGDPRQRKRLDRAIGTMAVLIIPIAVSVHTVVSWVFGMLLQPGWHSTIFGPYFVTGAIFSGIAMLILTMVVVRRVLHLERYLKPIHFNYLGRLLTLMLCLWFYFTFAEHLTTGYGGEGAEMRVLGFKLSGPYSLPFWGMVAFMAAAFVLLVFKKGRVIPFTFIASLFVIAGMWLERFTIVIPTLTRPLAQGYKAGLYHPTWVEWSITAGAFAAFVLSYMIFCKLFPIVSIWEMKEGEEAIPVVRKRVESYLPEPAE